MIKEGVRIDYLTKQIAKLNAIRKNMENRDNTDPRIDGITNRIAKLQREKENWEGIYKAIEDAPVIKEFGDVPSQPPAQYQQATNSIINADFLNFIKQIENEKLEGRRINGVWYPHMSPEGGLATIGFGHKIQNHQELMNFREKGLTDVGVKKLLEDDLKKANKKVHDYIEKYYGAKIMLNQKQEEMLTEFAFNLGGLNKFPKFVEAVLKNDMNTMRREFKRFYRTPGGVKPIEMERRNKLFYDRYLSSPIKENIILDGVRLLNKNDNILIITPNDDGTDTIINFEKTIQNKYMHSFKGYPLFIAYQFNSRINRNKVRNIIKSVDIDDIKLGIFYDRLKEKGLTDRQIKIGLSKIIYFKDGDKEEDYLLGKDAIIKMIDMSLNQFTRLEGIDSFDLIISAPSKSHLNTLILNEFLNRVSNKNIVKPNVLIKSSINKLSIFLDQYHKLKEPARQKLNSIWNSLKNKSVVKGKDFYEIKNIPAEMRYLIHNFIELKSGHGYGDVIKRLQNGKILIVDDTFGSGATFLDIIREIEPFKPKQIILYAFLKDYTY